MDIGAGNAGQTRNLRGAAVGSAGGGSMQAPLADREPVEHVVHGDRRVDHYAWMRNKKDPRVKAYLEAENAYADAQMRGTEGLQEKLYLEMLGRILQTDLSVPYRLRGYEYYTRTEEGKQYPIYCRRKAGSGPAGAPPSGAQDDTELMEELRRQVREGFGLGSQKKPEQNENDQSSVAQGNQRVAPSDLQAEPQEEVLLDLNHLAAGHTFLGLGIFDVSDDNRYLAYATDTTGYRQYVLQVKDLQRGDLLPFRAERVTSAAWAMDNRTLFYVTEDAITKRSNQLWRHEFPFEESATEEPNASLDSAEMAEPVGPVDHHGEASRAATDTEDHPVRPGTNAVAAKGTPSSKDDLIYAEKDERFRMDVERSRSGAYVFLVINSHTASEVRYLRADSPFSALQVMAERQDEHEYYVDHHPGNARDAAGGVFFIRTNSGGRTYRLVTAPVRDPGRAQWHEVLGNRPGVMLSGLEVFRTHLVLTEREDGLPHLRIVDLTRESRTAMAASYRLTFAEPAYQVMVSANPEFDTDAVRFQYESLVTPRSVYDYQVKTGQWILRKQQAVLGSFDPGNYVSERLHAKAADGTSIPISLVRRKNTTRDGDAPLLLYGYGSYGFSMPVTFSSNRLSLLDRGIMYAVAHVRGGGELGKPWHDAGRMHKKMNTFTDFIACADFLVAKRYTSPERLVIEGGSAGGLLMGAVANMAPEKFHLVVSHVPFVDVLNTMMDPTLPLTVGEYEEWGNPEVEEDYFYIKGYCPYTNVERKAYPRMLVKTAWNDSQVMYWEAAKYVAKLRCMKTGGNVLVLKTNMGAGHGGASGRYDLLREIAFDYAFMLKELGLDGSANEEHAGPCNSTPA
jgi:oligopeptidase B